MVPQQTPEEPPAATPFSASSKPGAAAAAQPLLGRQQEAINGRAGKDCCTRLIAVWLRGCSMAKWGEKRAAVDAAAPHCQLELSTHSYFLPLPCILAAAMLGFMVAIATELTTQQSVWSQIAGELGVGVHVRLSFMTAGFAADHATVLLPEAVLCSLQRAQLLAARCLCKRYGCSFRALPAHSHRQVCRP